MNGFSQKDIQTMVKAVINEVFSKQKGVLEEGKRDNQLLPYLQMFNEKSDKQISLGEFKTMMLRKLSTEGNIHNISLQSNYYLVGAVKYYFQGLLTNGGELGVFTDSEDSWNLKVCQQLNALILVLRNGYIDSVGATWVEPEDFGTMNLKDLFTKYKKEIKKVISKTKQVIDTKEDDAPKEYQMPNQNYTYDIIYNFNDATKYNDATSPGAWCITYGSNHLRHYTSRGNGHFVIFRKNGYDSVPREAQKEKWIGDKPQDDYGNSLIAYLQDNNSPGPANYDGAPLITSRWNHGYGGIYCEADRAYTQEEFQRITGVSNEDLNGIYKTWKTFAPLRSDNSISDKKEKATDDDIRALKYIQMRINGGENPENLMANYVPSAITNISSIKNNDRYIFFVIVGKKILFETASIGSGSIIPLGKRLNVMYFQFAGNKRYFIVNLRTKSLVYIEDMWSFKAINYSRWEENNNEDLSNSLVSVKQANLEIALLDENTGIPLKLPNGHYWFNSLIAGWQRSSVHGRVDGNRIYKTGILEIIYDLSSGEKYFYDSMHNRFLDLGQNNGDKTFYIYSDEVFGINSDIVAFLETDRGIALRTQYGGIRWDALRLSKQRIFKNGEPTAITFEVDGELYKIGDNGPENAIKIDFKNMFGGGNNIAQILIKKDEAYGSMNSSAVIYNGNIGSLISSPGKNSPLILTGEKARYKSIDVLYNLMLTIEKRRVFGQDSILLYNIKSNKYIENPYQFPNKYEFYDLDVYERSNGLILFQPTALEKRDDQAYNDFWEELEKSTVYYDPINDRFKKKVEKTVSVDDNGHKEVEDEYIDDPQVYGAQAYSLTEQDIMEMVSKVTSKINEIRKRKK